MLEFEYTVGTTAWERHKRIVELRNGITDDFLYLAEELIEIKDNADYKSLGHPTFESYIADPDVDIGRRTAYRLIAVYEIFSPLPVTRQELILVGITKLDMIRPFVDVEKNVQELVTLAATLSRSDLAIELAERYDIPLPVKYFDRELSSAKRHIWDAQELADDYQRDLLKRAYELIIEAEQDYLGKQLLSSQ
jgi:hypothetical protein